MEPFQLTLQQVTFEEGDLSPTQELDSFSNVVHYDSQFTTAPAISTAALSYAQTFDHKAVTNRTTANQLSRSRTIAQPSRVKTSQIYSHSVCTPCVLNSSRDQHLSNLYHPYHIPEGTAPLINPDSCFVDNTEGFITRKSRVKVTNTDIRTLFQVSANTSSTKKKKLKKLKKPVMSSSDSGVADDTSSPGADGPQAFESVAEALHLQWSVIGDKKLTPAPPEVVAQIVAEAEKRIKSQSTSASPVPQVSPMPPLTRSATNLPKTSPLPDTALSLNTTDPVIPSPNSVQSKFSSKEESGSSSPGVLRGQGDADRLLENKMTSPSPTKELIRIRIPTESITTTKEKSSWFGSKSDSPQNAIGKDRGTSPLGSKVGMKSEDQGSEKDSLSEDKDEIQSVSSATSELESFGQSETEKFLKSLPPVKHIDLNSIMPKSSVIRRHSPPVKETSFRPLSSHSPPPVPHTTATDFAPNTSAHEILSQFSDSGLSFDADQVRPSEIVPSPVVTSTPNKTSFIMPQIGPLFNRPLKSLHVNKPMPKLSDGSKTNNKQYEEVLKEKAKLEGQLEMLSVEAQTTLQERAELQAQVASLKLKLMANKESSNDQEHDALKTELEKLQRVKGLLEQSLGSAQKFLEEKVTEAKILQEELQSSQETQDKLQIKVKEVRDDLRAKEMTIQALKNKIAELYVEVQTVLQAKMESDNEARSSKNDLVSLINTKDWYQKQLQSAQEARTKLQHELTSLQAQTSSQGSIIERLKTENTKLRQQLKDTQQRALKEKELLAKHLENIETDMMDREAAFQEIQRERTLLEDTFDTKLQSVENEKSRIGTLLQMTADLESQLERAQTDLKKKQSQIITLENEQIDMMKKLTLSQESVIEKDNIIEELNQKLIQVETELKAFQTGMGNKESEVWKLKEEKAAIEISLHAALEEKSTVDKALDMLKADMGKVEKSFRLMKQELGNKSTDYDVIRKEKSDLQEELDEIKEKLDQELKGNRMIQKETDDKVIHIDELRTQKVKLEEEVKFLEGEVKILKNNNCECAKQKESIESELLSVKENLIQKEAQLTEVTAELKQTKLEERPLQSTPDKDLVQENVDLKQAMAKSEKQAQKDLTKQKAKVAKLNTDLKSLQNELTERQNLLEGNVELLSSKLREVTADKEKLETELNMAHRKYDLSMLQQQDTMKTELQSLAAELETMKIQKQGLENQLFEIQRVKELEVNEYQKQLSALDEELAQQKESQSNAEELEEINQKLSLELEKEKGRVAGLMQTNTSLKQHVSELEDALARRESALVELQGQAQASLREKESEEEEYIRRIQSLEEGLKQEKDSQRDLRKQIGSKISENKKVKRQLETQKCEKETLQQDLEHKTQEAEGLKSELENSKQLQLVQQGQLHTLDTDNKGLMHQLERAKRELADNLAREPIIQEQIMSLQWQLDQKCKELEAAQGQMSIADDRQQLEVEDLHKTVQEQKTELESLRKELTEAKQEKLTHQSEMAELRSTLKASLQHHKLTKKLNKSQNGDITTRETGTQVETNDIIIPPLPFDLEVVEKLVQESAVKALESKPLDNLQNCLSSLRSEISGLQLQMENHTAVVTTSNESWNSVESQVNELRQIVKTITNTTQHSNTTDSLAAAAVHTASGAIFDV